MNFRNETEILQRNDDMVLAQQDDCFVAVVKIQPIRASKRRYAIIVTERGALKNRRGILRNGYYALNPLIISAYKAIYEVINVKR
jgi:hypothetical protein